MTVHNEMDAIARRARVRNLRRQIRYNRVRKLAVGRLPTMLPEFVKMLLGSLLGFAILSELLRYFADVSPRYVLPGLGLLYSSQASVYAYRLAADPTYEVPKCGCAGAANDKTEVVLRSSASSILGVPNSVLATVLYVMLLILVYSDHDTAALLPAIVTVVGSIYLGYVMVVRLASLCPTCVNIAALNLLILLQLVR